MFGMWMFGEVLGGVNICRNVVSVGGGIGFGLDCGCMGEVDGVSLIGDGVCVCEYVMVWENCVCCFYCLGCLCFFG